MAASPSRSWWTRAVWVGFAIVVYFALFRLPYYFPPRQRLVSSSYAFGFNNGVAILAMTALLGAAALYLRLLGGPGGSDPLVKFPDAGSRATRLPWWLFVTMAGVYAALTAVMYAYARAAAVAPLTWEARHFLHRIKLVETYGMRPYAEIHVEYGPALMYPPIYLHRLLAPLGISTEGAYFLCHVLMNIAGLGCLWYLLTRAEGPPRAKAIAFAVVGIAGFAPYMGLNGVVLRYALPFAAVLAGHRAWLALRREAAAAPGWVGMGFVVAVLAGANILLSPEIAVAFALGWLGYTALGIRVEWRLLVVSVVAIAGAAAASYLLLPAEYYASLLRFSQGANNLPMVPAAHLVLYVATLILIVPPLVAAGLRGGRSDAPLVGSLGVLSVVMMPGALGRCDPPHVLFYGLVVSMLLMMRLAGSSRGAFRAYVFAYGVVSIGMMQVVNLVCFFGVDPEQLLIHPRWTLRSLLERQRGEFVPRDHAYLSALDKYPAIGLPFATYGGDNAAEAYLFARRKVDPEFYVGAVGVYTGADIARKLADTARHEFLLVPKGWEKPWHDSPAEKYLSSQRRWFLYPVRLRWIRPDLDSHGEINRLIAERYRVVEAVGPSVVVQRIGEPQPSAGESTAP